MSNPIFTAPNFTTQTAAQYKANLDAAVAANGPDSINIGCSYDASAGVFSIHGMDGTALSTANPGFIKFQDRNTLGYHKYISVEANQSFIDDTGSSEILNNLFGYATGVAITEAQRFFIYGVTNDDMDTVQFMLSKQRYITTSPAAASIGAPDDAVADTLGSFWSLDNIDESVFELNPCTIVGTIRMVMSSSDDWTVQALFKNDGIGQHIHHIEEGLWVPVAAGSTGAGSATYSAQAGRYTRVGSQITIWWYVFTSSTHSGSGNLRITNLPYAAVAKPAPFDLLSYGNAAFNNYDFNDAATAYVLSRLAASASELVFEQNKDNAAAVELALDTSTSWEVRGTITYTAAEG